MFRRARIGAFDSFIKKVNMIFWGGIFLKDLMKNHWSASYQIKLFAKFLLKFDEQTRVRIGDGIRY